MKRQIALFTITALLAGCAGGGTHKTDSDSWAWHGPRGGVHREPQASLPSPCEDSLYLELRDKALDQMTDREYEYFSRKDSECDRWMQAQGIQTREKKDRDTTRGTIVALSLMSIVGGIAIASRNF